jgi:sporulation protein YlmC with PRC-barrel domain
LVLTLKVNKLNGMRVITDDAFTLGEVDGAEASTVTWQITHLDLALTKEATQELGFKKPMLGSVTICLPTSAIKKVGDVITLDFSLKAFKNLKECQIE